MCFNIRKLFLGKSGKERPSPGDWVKRDQIEYLEKQGLLTIRLDKGVKIFSVADTNSMDGLLDIGHNVIATKNFDKLKLKVGDVVVYQIYTTLIVHRIIKITEDSGGRLYRCQGDNNVEIDKWYLRDVNIQYLVIGIIY